MKIITKRYKPGLEIPEGENVEDYFITKDFIMSLYNKGTRVILIPSARGCGKSQSLAELVYDFSISKGKKFVYVRNTAKEVANVGDIAKQGKFAEKLGYAAVRIDRGKEGKQSRSGAINLYGYDIIEESTQEVHREHIGFALDLSKSYQFKSGFFDDYNLVVFEEYNVRDMTYTQRQRYINNFLDIFETFFRRREDVLIYGCANNTGGVSPLEIEFSESSKAVKIKAFKKYGDKGLLSEIKGDFRKYLDGESLDFKKLNMSDYVQLDYIQLPSKKYIFLYVHRYKHGYNDILITDKGNFKHREIPIIFYRQFDDIEYKFKNNYVEELFLSNYEFIRRDLQKRLEFYDKLKGVKYIE